jgi:hypothetical protein
VTANAGTVDHVLPVVGKTKINQRLQQRIPDALFGPAPEPDIDRVPLAVALMHVAPIRPQCTETYLSFVAVAGATEDSPEYLQALATTHTLAT